jgi:hypothetical protein
VFHSPDKALAKNIDCDPTAVEFESQVLRGNSMFFAKGWNALKYVSRDHDQIAVVAGQAHR